MASESPSLSSCEDHPTEETSKEDNVNEKLDMAASNLWKKFHSIASFVAEKTVEIGVACGEEMAHFADEVKIEASDIYKDHLADKVNNIKETIPKMIPNSLLTYVEGAFPNHQDTDEMTLESVAIINFDEEYLLKTDKDPKWLDFLESSNIQLNAAHKDALLKNDLNLATLHSLLIPSRIDEEYFWKRWIFWRDNCAASKKSGRPPVIRQTEEGDSVNVSITNLSQQQSSVSLSPTTLLPSASASKNSPDWDSWE